MSDQHGKCGRMHKRLPWPRFCHLDPEHVKRGEAHETVYQTKIIKWKETTQ